MRRHTWFAVLAAMFLLQGCGTLAYTPTQYPLRDGLIPAFAANGPVSIGNAQPSKDAVIVYSYGGSKLSSDLHAITETMVQQSIGELAKHGKVNPTGPSKTIELKVNSLVSRYIAFYWKSTIDFEVKLGNGKVIRKNVPHSSGVLLQDLNGCIAEGVMTLFNDEEVRAYLAE
jgi:hypothetical protein